MIVIDQIFCRLCLETGIGGLKLMNQAQLSFLESFRLVNDAGFVGEGVRVRRVADILNTSLGSGGGFFGRVRVGKVELIIDVCGMRVLQSTKTATQGRQN